MAQTITGAISDAATQKPLSGVNISIPKQKAGAVSDTDGKFVLNSALKPPFTLQVSLVGYTTQEVAVNSESQVSIQLFAQTEELDQVVVSASRVEERILRSPVSIEKMDAKAIQLSPSANFYDALLNMKSVDLITSSLTYKQILHRH